MKKIAIVINHLTKNISKGGGGVVVRNLIKQWQKNPDIKIDIYCYSSEFEKLLGINEIFVVKDLEEAKQKTDRRTYSRVIYTEKYVPYNSVLIQAHSLKHRRDLNNNFFVRSLMGILNSKKIKAQSKLFSKKNDRFYTVSEGIKEDYVKNYGLDAGKFRVIYPGVEPYENYKEKPQKKVITFGISARSNLNKGGHRFLLALALLKLRKIEFEAIMICTKYEKAPLIRFLINLLRLKNDVEILDHVEDMSKFYNRIDCMVVPSRHEAFALVALEACSHGVVPLVSKNCGFCEIAKDGENAVFFDINKSSIANLAEGMGEIVELYRNDFTKFRKIQNNCLKLAKRYTWEDFADKFYEEI